MIIHYVDGVCGSYKTTHALEFAVKSATKLRQPILFVQPTTKLITQSVDVVNKISSKVVVKRFDSSVCAGSVFSDLHEFMNEWDIDDDGGCIVFITHKCLWEMPWFPNRSKWNLIIDEIPDVDFEYHLNLPDAADFALQSVLQANECGLNAMLKLTARPEKRSQVQHWARNTGADDLIKVVQPLFRELTSQHSNVFVTRASWQRLGWEGHGQVAVHGWRSPSVCDGWCSVRIMGAFFTDSLLHMIWLNMDVEFREDNRIKVLAQRHNSDIGKRVSIHYFSEKSWSKKVRDKIANDDDPLVHIKPIITGLWGDNEFLWSANKDIPDAVIGTQFANGIRIPAVCHGLNEYRHVSRIAFLSALNNTPGHFSYADKVLGISSDQLRQARSHQVAYQSIMRTALRDADSTAEVTVLVPDIGLGNWLAEVFPGSTLHAHEAAAECREVLGSATKARGRPQKVSKLTATERSARRFEKNRELIRTKNSIYKVFFVRNDIDLSHELSVQSLNVQRSTHINWDDVRSQFRQCLDQIQPKKEDNSLISGALFDLDKDKETTKGLTNIVAVNGMWLDFDDGLLMPDEFARMFPDIRWMLFNSFNNGKNGQTKYRVVSPTKSPMTQEMYHRIWDAVADRIKDFGYYVGTDLAYEKALKSGRVLPEKSGLDVSKRTANSFFYLPCRAGLGKQYTFWRENWGDNIPLLDPEVWLTYAPLEAQEYELKPPHQNARSDKLQVVADKLNSRTSTNDNHAIEQDTRDAEILTARQNAISDWRSTPPGTGNNAFYRLACKLKVYGMDDNEIRSTLNTEATYGRSPSERRREIPGIMSALRKFTPTKQAA
jgi:hypothetical protein